MHRGQTPFKNLGLLSMKLIFTLWWGSSSGAHVGRVPLYYISIRLSLPEGVCGLCVCLCMCVCMCVCVFYAISILWVNIYIYIYIYIHTHKHTHISSSSSMISCHRHGYPWPSLATSPYCSSPLAGLQGYIPYPHIADVYMFKLWSSFFCSAICRGP